MGVRAGMAVLVPIAVVASFILASASKFVIDDIAAAHAEALTRTERAAAPIEILDASTDGNSGANGNRTVFDRVRYGSQLGCEVRRF